MTDRPTSPRIEPITEVDGEVAEILAGALTRDGKPINIFGVLAHHPKLLKRFNLFAGYLLNKGLLPDREREIVILRIGWNARSQYEFGQHTVIGAQSGLTDEEIVAITQDPDEVQWSAGDRALVALADELCDDDCVTDETWSTLSSHWSEAQLIELLAVAGFYRLVSGFLNSTGVPLDPGVPGFPRD
jgi:4-carboxymuconolactone decarboxylase